MSINNNNEEISEIKNCKICNFSFKITNKDLDFYDKISPVFLGKKYIIPSPTLCPECRNQRRISFLNQTKLYKNICKGCGKNIMSRFHIESGILNYCNSCWSGDNWDQLKFGTEFNFSKTSFEQIQYLIKNTPFQNLIGSSTNIKNNAVYTNHTSEIKNSYLVFEANTIEDSLFSFGIKNSKNLVDCSFVGNSEILYESVDCYDMFQSFFCEKSYNCKMSYFLKNCTNCDFCIGCTNLNNKKYYILNKEANKTEYDLFIKKLESYKFINDFKAKFLDINSKTIIKQYNILGSENCIGHNIINSKNCINSYDILECQNLKYSYNINYSQDFFDVSSYGENSYLILDSVSTGRYSHNIIFSDTIGKGENLMYCIDVKKSKNCFLCVNLEEKEYCILNKQYSKEKYEEIAPKIIEHMKKNGEWGEFFHSSISPFGYNETIAQDYFYLSKNDAIERGFCWSEYEPQFPKVEKIISANLLPDKISSIPDDIINWAIQCEKTKKPFRILKQELDFYRKYQLPIPRNHPDQRYKERLKLRNNRKLFERKCGNCEKDILTTYSKEKSEIIYCEECYNKKIY